MKKNTRKSSVFTKKKKKKKESAKSLIKFDKNLKNKFELSNFNTRKKFLLMDEK